MADLERFIAADHPDRLLAPELTEGNVHFRVDRTHEQPLIVARLVAGRLKVIARFSDAGEAARLYSPDRRTLPAPIVRQLANQ